MKETELGLNQYEDLKELSDESSAEIREDEGGQLIGQIHLDFLPENVLKMILEKIEDPATFVHFSRELMEAKKLLSIKTADGITELAKAKVKYAEARAKEKQARFELEKTKYQIKMRLIERIILFCLGFGFLGTLVYLGYPEIVAKVLKLF